MSILVSGGSGYIGSHTVRLLREQGREVVVLDNLSTGHRRSVPDGVPLVEADIADGDAVADAVRRYGVDGVVHFAANSLVGESMQEPHGYYQNNVAKGIAFLGALKKAGVLRMIFSSTSAVYGDSEVLPITEDCALRPSNVYGRTKLMMEQILQDFDRAYGMKYCALRYFNAAGAHPSGEIGEDHGKETHLLPIIMQVALGKRENLTIFGADYPTQDGTCVRDYIHVCDLAAAHLLALEHLERGGRSRIFNLGNGRGFSVREVVETAQEVTGRMIPVVEGLRRSGDPAILIAGGGRIEKELGFAPQFTSLTAILETAWRWHSSYPEGYGD
ncbi:MAG: UDP-glucose 4-epimerase GalE [Christensenellales bacterium]